mmetsp:Transcript_5720/g.8555  ORF Transcript_5720/g.8555 Transcript_5720/m.8555 type:complete len:197 (-) Transcript_5720:130-720(-)
MAHPKLRGRGYSSTSSWHSWSSSSWSSSSWHSWSSKSKSGKSGWSSSSTDHPTMFPTEYPTMYPTQAPTYCGKHGKSGGKSGSSWSSWWSSKSESCHSGSRSYKSGKSGHSRRATEKRHRISGAGEFDGVGGSGDGSQRRLDRSGGKPMRKGREFNLEQEDQEDKAEFKPEAMDQPRYQIVRGVRGNREEMEPYNM